MYITATSNAIKGHYTTGRIVKDDIYYIVYFRVIEAKILNGEILPLKFVLSDMNIIIFMINNEEAYINRKKTK